MFKLFLTLPFVPEFAKEMIANNEAEIRKAITEAPSVDPVATAITELEKVKDYCFGQLLQYRPCTQPVLRMPACEPISQAYSLRSP